jgi:hypothetical protein
MYSKDKLLQMIVSDKASTRYDACEWLRIRQESSPEIIYALQQATHDLDPEVAKRASLALQAEVHHQMAIQMGLIPPDPVVSEPESGQEAGGIESSPDASVPPVLTAMNREIRSWAWWSIGLGVIHFFTAGFLNAWWGTLLIIVGLASFIFKTSAIFVVYCITMLGAALLNFSSLTPGWVFFAIFQLYLVVRIFIDYRRFHKAEKAYLGTSAGSADRTYAERAERVFPWIGPVLSCSSVLGFVLLFMVMLVVAIATNNLQAYAGFTGFMEGLLIDLAVLGFAVGLSSTLSGYRPKLAGIVAIVSAVIFFIIEVGLPFVFKS